MEKHSKNEHFLSINLKYLRNKRQISQQQLADQLGIARSSLAEYERGKTEPNLDTLIKISKAFNITLDALITQNIQHQDYEILKTQSLKVLAITVDQHNRENIELVDTKAEAGYLENAHDPEYIRELPKIFFPKLPEGTYRGFEIRGDSMWPMMPGTLVICRYVESIQEVKNNKTYVIVTQREGLVYKRVLPDYQKKILILQSDNPLYIPYEVKWEDIKEIWEYHAHLAFSDIKQALENSTEEKISDIQKKVSEIHRKIQDRS